MIQKQELDFEILKTGNSKTIVFLDSSQYFESPDAPILQITPPGFSKYFVVNIAFGKINTLNSSLIGLSQVFDSSCITDLADGVWKFTYRICPYDKLYITKYHLRVAQLNKKLNQIFDFADCDCEFERDEKLKKDIVDIMLLIAKGEANAEEGEPAKASEAYQKASKKINKLLEKLQKMC